MIEFLAKFKFPWFPKWLLIPKLIGIDNNDFEYAKYIQASNLPTIEKMMLVYYIGQCVLYLSGLVNTHIVDNFRTVQK